jgi:hypothetical protein
MKVPLTQPRVSCYRQMAPTITPIKTQVGIWKIAIEIIRDEIENLKHAGKNI